jgi:hypothetical protein
MSKVGVYISGLGQSFHKEDVQKYAERFKNELLFNERGSVFKLKSEIITYSVDKKAKVVRILRRDDSSIGFKVFYSFYEFEYHELLTERFNKQNILYKNLILCSLVLKKLPQLIKRIFVHDHYNRPYLSFYAFSVLFIISLAIILLIPATVDMVSGFKGGRSLIDFFNLDFIKESSLIKNIYRLSVPLVTFILLLVPESKTIITSVATEFACADRYLSDGIQNQLILGNLDLLVEFISENEPDSKIQFHCYSFGSLVAMDFLFPLGNIPSTNTTLFVDALITIGNPYEFINSYYSTYFLNRNSTMEQRIKWMNVYSMSDALSSNFRTDSSRGKAAFGLNGFTLKPVNLNYEVSPDKSQNFFNFITMDGIRMHRLYWDAETNGQSCVRVLLNKMIGLNLLKNE